MSAAFDGFNKVGVSAPSPEDGNISGFRNVVLWCSLVFLEYRMVDKTRKPSNLAALSDCEDNLLNYTTMSFRDIS
jgi:hypothetical protein